MNGLELSRKYYETFGAPGIHEQFPELEGLVAVGLCGSGSECCGYDDETSRDHDFEPGFCLFLPEEDTVDRKAAFQLERLYAKLPREFEGFSRSVMSPVGGNRHGVLRISEFFAEKVGSPDGVLTVHQWLTIPTYSLLEATNGAVYRDDLGQFTAIRARLARFPEDIRRKRLAGQLLLMAQSGQYNYNRCLHHDETGAAQLAVIEFCRATMAAVFLLNDSYMPYYKWSFRAMKALPVLGEIADTLEMLLTTDNQCEMAEQKYFAMESIAGLVIDELMAREMTKATCGDLEKHAYSVNDSIEDGGIRNLHILAAV